MYSRVKTAYICGLKSEWHVLVRIGLAWSTWITVKGKITAFIRVYNPVIMARVGIRMGRVIA